MNTSQRNITLELWQKQHLNIVINALYKMGNG
jgi:hypothetical protein